MMNAAATRPCEGSFRLYAQSAPPPLKVIWPPLKLANGIAPDDLPRYLWDVGPVATQCAFGRPTMTSSPPGATELYTAMVAPVIVGSPVSPLIGGMMRNGATGSFLVLDLKLTRRRVESPVRSLSVSLVVGMGRKVRDGGGGVLVEVVVTLVDVVVLPPGGVLDASAGSLPASSSSRSKKPSSSRSIPMRVPEPGGAQR